MNIFFQIAERLLLRGAKSCKVNTNFRTPLHEAVLAGEGMGIECVRAFGRHAPYYAYGERDENGKTAMALVRALKSC